jgi:hypothetical protein
MKSSGVLLLSLPVALGAPNRNAVFKRQRAGGEQITAMNGLLGAMFPSSNSYSSGFSDRFADKPVKVTEIKGETPTRPGAKFNRYWYGPFDVPAGKVRVHLVELNVLNMM